MRWVWPIQKTVMILIITLAVFTLVVMWQASQQRCIPHDTLLQMYGRPDPCDGGHMILHCSNPELDYLDDLDVLSSCRLINHSSEAQYMSDILPIPVCNYKERTLLSDKQLPVKPPPMASASKVLVPNIVHYVNLGCERVFSFANYLSVLSVHKFVDPYRIYFHGDCTPIGVWWERTLQEVPNIYFRKHRRQQTIQGRPPMWIEHESDVIRLQILLAEGGIYLDTDVIVLSSLEDLRPFPVSLGREPSSHNKGLGNSFIIAQPNSPFICMWLHAYREYNPVYSKDWATYSTLSPGKIAMRFPDHVHVENASFYNPSWNELHKIYDGFYDWSQNYVLHLWNHAAKTQEVPKSPSAISSKYEVNCTLHEVFRYIYFDEKIITAKKCNNISSLLPSMMAKCIGSHHSSRVMWIVLVLCVPGIMVIFLAWSKVKLGCLKLRTSHRNDCR